MTFTVIDAPPPAELISISTAAVPLMALYSKVPPDLVVFSTCQPRDQRDRGPVPARVHDVAPGGGSLGAR